MQRAGHEYGRRSRPDVLARKLHEEQEKQEEKSGRRRSRQAKEERRAAGRQGGSGQATREARSQRVQNLLGVMVGPGDPKLRQAMPHPARAACPTCAASMDPTRRRRHQRFQT